MKIIRPHHARIPGAFVPGTSYVPPDKDLPCSVRIVASRRASMYLSSAARSAISAFRYASDPPGSGNSPLSSSATTDSALDTASKYLAFRKETRACCFSRSPTARFTALDAPEAAIARFRGRLQLHLFRFSVVWATSSDAARVEWGRPARTVTPKIARGTQLVPNAGPSRVSHGPERGTYSKCTTAQSSLHRTVHGDTF